MATKSRKSNTSEKPFSKKAKKKKIILLSVGLGAAGILGYFGWQHFKKKKSESKNDEVDKILAPKITEPVYTRPDTIPKPKYKLKKEPVYIPTIPVTPKERDDFPLKRGSKGDKVKLLQQALLDNYGKSILPRYGADGDFGSEMLVALKKLNLPSTVDENVFNVLVKGSGTNTTKDDTAKQLYDAAIAKNLSKVMTLLKKIRNKDDYSTVSSSFKTYRINGVRQTLVNGLLNSFTDEKQKQQIRLEFTRMGLQYDGNKWSLSGLDGIAIITKQSTMVWKDAQTGVQVPGNMVLGNEVATRLSYTLFENKGQYYLVKTNSIKYL